MAGLITRSARTAVAVVATVAMGVGASACGNGQALADARTACTKVNHSIAIYKKSLNAPTPAASAKLVAQAQSDLLAALGPAALATSGDGSFNSLMTTLQEADRVSEKYLVESLQRQCQVVFSSTPYLAQ